MKQHNTKENIVIPISIERVKFITRCSLEATSWLICLSMLSASALLAGFGVLVWFITGSETILTLGCTGGLLLGLAGLWSLLLRIDQSVKHLKKETPDAA